MHCKRHSHNLPKNALIKTSKTPLISPQINVQFLVLPLIFDSNLSSHQMTNQSNVTQNQKLINILPKSEELKPQNDFGTQTSVSEECNKCKNNTKSENNVKNGKNCNSISTQTERLSQKSSKSGEQRSTDCQTIRKRNRKPHNNYESIETQTLESTLHLTQTSSRENSLKISASTSTSPPKKTKKRCSLSVDKSEENSAKSFDVKKSCAFTQTVCQSCTSTSTTTDDELFVNYGNPLLSQMNPTNNILEQSVQTEAIEFCLDNEFNNIETQTVNLDVSSDDLLDFGANEEFLFSDLEFTDIETQTIWNNDRTTQTDEYLDQINDVFLRYLDNESGCHISNKTLFADTQTQTQKDFPSLICSSAQTSNTFS